MSDKGDLIHLDEFRSNEKDDRTTSITFTKQQNEGFQIGIIYGVLKHRKPHLWGCQISKHLLGKAESISDDMGYKNWVKDREDGKVTIYFYDPERYEGEIH